MTRSDVVAAWEALLRVHAVVVPTIAAEVERATALPLSWYDVLLELSRAPEGRLRMQDLGERVVLSRSRVSRIVDAMERAGLVARQPDPEDGRAILATQTAVGQRAFRRVAPLYLASIERHVGAGLEPRAAAALHAALQQILEAQRREDHAPE